MTHFIRSVAAAMVAPLSLILSTGIASTANAQETKNDQPQKADNTTTAIELYEGPQYKTSTNPRYPSKDQSAGIEGWVEVGYMVDPNGKPYEFTILNSSGDNKSLHDASLKALQEWTFKPATLNGSPIDSGFSTKFIFRFTDLTTSASSDFVGAFKKFEAAVAAKDKVAAEALLKKLKVQNLYEDAFYGLAQYEYAELQGDVGHQLAGIRRAVAGEKSATYLPKKLFRFAIQRQLALELATRDFASALITWPIMKSVETDKALLQKYEASIKEVRALQSDRQSFRVAASLDDGRWNYRLFKRKFHVAVKEGFVTQIKLRCDKNYVFFQFDPTIEYQIPEQYGACAIEVVGDGNSKFDLIQG